ncbi:hypothetical protein GCM10027289_28040 [Tsukamurella serpentis]
MRPLPSQLAMLRLAGQLPGTAALDLMAAWSLSVPVDEALLLRAVEDTVAETQACSIGAMRTAAGTVELRTADPAPVHVRHFDTDEQFRDHLDGPPLPLDGSALFRAMIAKVGPTQRVVLHAHHAVLDGYGVTLVFRRIHQRYTAALGGSPLPLRRLGDLDEVAAGAATLRAPDLAFWGRAIDGVAALGEEISFGPAPARPAERPLRHRIVVDVGDSLARAAWPSEAAATVAAYTVGHLGTRTARIGVVAALRRTPAERTTPMQWMAALPTRVDISADTTPARAGEQVRHWLDEAALRVAAGERPEQLMTDVPAAWRTGRLYGPTVNVLPYAGSTPWSLDVLAWGPVTDCLINILRRRDGELTVDGAFHPDLYSPQQAAEHIDAIGELLAAALPRPDRPFDRVAPRPVDPDRIAVPGGWVVPDRIRSALSGAGFAADEIELHTGPGMTVVVHTQDSERLSAARDVVPPGVRVRLGGIR